MVKAICEIPFVRKPACIDELRAMVACFKAAPISAWHCDDEETADIEESTCSRAALAACIE
jgi:hypothetical protein